MKQQEKALYGKAKRRDNALVRLEMQLVSGVKKCKGKLGLKDVSEPLTENDTKRINNEIATLKKR